MGNIESVPVVSQAKSLVQYVGGDREGAKETQEQFIRTGIVASQINSFVHYTKVNLILSFVSPESRFFEVLMKSQLGQ